jgi:hypothetical protein
MDAMGAGAGINQSDKGLSASSRVLLNKNLPASSIEARIGAHSCSGV